MNFPNHLWACFLFLLMLVDSLVAGDNERTVIATRATSPPRIDGYLDEAVWQVAQPANGFLQRDPHEGQPETEKTEIRILYDNEALYFGCMMHDAEPDEIVARLTRRDSEIESDAISIRIDSYHDHQTAYEFTILAAGVKVDILQFNDAQDEDSSWDAVWEVKTQIFRTRVSREAFTLSVDSSNFSLRGWSAEVKIPFSILRYTSARNGKNVWGINFIRRLSRKNERDYWALVRKNQSGFVSHFGHLLIEGSLPNPRRFELLPYSVANGKFVNQALASPATDTRDFGSNIGFDLKYGLNSYLTLDLTVNPDFGQVEADPAVLNLSTFETFYPEKRPFFIEGTQILQFTTFGGEFGPGLFYSRRIGRAPTGKVTVPVGGYLKNLPTATTILGAAKITGKTAGGLAVGILQALTAEENATVIDASGKTSSLAVEPRASYNVVRFKQDVLQNSTVGVIATSVAKDHRWPAFTGGVDWNLRFHQSAYSLDGFLASSHTTQNTTHRITGSAGRFRFGKDGGTHWRYSASTDFTSRHYNINDIGFFRRPNDYGSNFELRYKEDQPGKVLRRWQISSDWHGRWNFDGARLANEYGWSIDWQWLNYWQMDLRAEYSPAVDDDRESRGHGLYRRPRQFFISFDFETDNRKPVIVECEQDYFYDARGQRTWNTEFGMTTRPASWSEINLQFGFTRARNRESWVTNLTDSLIALHPISIFGFRDTDEYDLRLRSTLSFTRDMTLQIYSQAFIAKGHYDRFQRLVTPIVLVPYPYTERADFNEKSFTLNVVFRWEYRPGSILYLVWTQARTGEGENFFSSLGRDVNDTFALPAENIVQLKLSYWLRP